MDLPPRVGSMNLCNAWTGFMLLSKNFVFAGDAPPPSRNLERKPAQRDTAGKSAIGGCHGAQCILASSLRYLKPSILNSTNYHPVVYQLSTATIIKEEY